MPPQNASQRWPKVRPFVKPRAANEQTAGPLALLGLLGIISQAFNGLGTGSIVAP